MEDNGMVTLNIYNKPPQLDDTGTNFNQTEQNLNLKTDRPQMNQTYYDNVRNDPNQNYNINSAQRTNKKINQNIQNSIEDESSESEPNKTPVIAAVPQYAQYPQRQQYFMPIGQPMAVPTPGMVPYNMPYAQPIVSPKPQINNQSQPVNNAPKTIIIREKERPRDTMGEDCCKGCLAGMTSCLAICCLMGLCCPAGPHGHRHHGW